MNAWILTQQHGSRQATAVRTGIQRQGRHATSVATGIQRQAYIMKGLLPQLPLRRWGATQFIHAAIIVLFIAAFLALPVGLGILASSNKGRFPDEYRNGYICGAEPPTQEEFTARSNVPVCLNMLDKMRPIYGPLCLQAGGLDKPAVWCNQKLEEVLWWSPCDKCGTAWRIFETQDNDQSWYKQPTSPQPNSSTIPLEDGWLKWRGDYWEGASLSISSCSSNEDEGTNFRTNGTNYDIPPACYSDEIFVQTNPLNSAGLPLVIIGAIAWYCVCLGLCPSDGDNGNSGGGGGELIN